MYDNVSVILFIVYLSLRRRFVFQAVTQIVAQRGNSAVVPIEISVMHRWHASIHAPDATFFGAPFVQDGELRLLNITLGQAELTTTFYMLEWARSLTRRKGGRSPPADLSDSGRDAAACPFKPCKLPRSLPCNDPITNRCVIKSHISFFVLRRCAG
jgi:hypothetical protein